MKDKGYAVGDTIKIVCAACGDKQDHTVNTVTKTGVVTKSTCTVCNTIGTYKNGVKTATSMTSVKSGTPYDQTRTYRKGQTMTHSAFGHGEVTAVIDTNKIDVLFGDNVKRLIHSRS